MVDMVQTSDELLTVKEAAALLKVSPYTIYRWVSAGRLPGVRYGRRVLRLRRSDVEAARSGVPRERGGVLRERATAEYGATGSDYAAIEPDLEDIRQFAERWRRMQERAAARPKAPGHGTVAALRRHFGVLDKETWEEFDRVIREMKARDLQAAIEEQRNYKPLFGED